MRRSILTGREDVIIDENICRPTVAVDEWVPGPFHRCALYPDEESAQTHGEVHRNDDEPNNCLHPAVGQPEQGQCEAGFGPDGCSDGESAGDVDNQI